MQVVILAGGLGTRLRPAVHDLPKAMAPVLGKPFLEHQLALLGRHGVREVVLCLGHRAAAIQHHFGDGARWGLRIVYSVEPQPLGTGGALRFAAPLLTGRCLVLNGDTYAPLDYTALVRYHAARDALVTLALTPASARGDYACPFGTLRAGSEPCRRGAVELDADGRVRAFREKLSSGSEGARRWVNAGVYVFEPQAVAHIPVGRPVSLEREVFPRLAEEGALFGYATDTYFADIGTPEQLARFIRDMEEGRVHDYPQ